ncbi:MAG: ribonuclease R [Eubacteriales bacterium]|nr:ribonuclease R [Eubacteriales bacterium]
MAKGNKKEKKKKQNSSMKQEKKSSFSKKRGEFREERLHSHHGKSKKIIHEKQEDLLKRNRRIKGELAEGIFIGNARGFGFVEIEGEEQDIFVPAEDTATAMHQDRVQIVIRPEQSKGKRREGAVVKILERGMPEIVGTFQKNHKICFVVSDHPKFSKDIYIPEKKAKGVKNGDKVVVTITDYGNLSRSPEGEIKEVLGNLRTPGTDILAIVRSYGLPEEFPEKVSKQADRVPDKISEADCNGRKDLRSVQMVTIDGEDAKDLDDAVSLSKEGNIWHLGVHIADVSNYVQGGSALDREALKRGTSVYLPDRVIPMLPKRLSNGICSLNAGEDRLALSCLMDLNEQGEMVSYEIAETVIRVDRRMSYHEVCEILENKIDREPYGDLVSMFLNMKELSDAIRRNRHSRGSIDFDFPEAKIILNEAGKAIDVVPYEANDATRIIEDFMLQANETVAREYCKEGLPFVYRTHEEPDPEKMESLLTLLRNQGIPVEKKGQDVTPKEVQQILEQIADLPNEAQISRLTLRTMKQAKYTQECSGHFGLAAKYYCHFTSPIRRYPDLQIHRIIKDRLRGRLEREGRTENYRGMLDQVCQQSSMCERRAQEVEREADKMKKAEYMSWHLGERFTGIISGVTGWGLYVELPNTVEGLVPIGSLRDDYYIFDQETSELIGEHTGRVYRLGEKVTVLAEYANVQEKTVDFILVEDSVD